MRSLLLALVVIQDSKARAFVRTVLEGAGHRVVDVEGGAPALALLANGLHPDILLFDSVLTRPFEAPQYREFLRYIAADRVCLIAEPGENELRRAVAEHGIGYFQNGPVVRANLLAWIDAFAQPAADAAPFGSAVPAVPQHVVTRESRTALPEDAPPVPLIEELGGGDFFLAASRKMLEIHRQVKLLADIDANVLILGESGTGKEVVARLIHKHSRRVREKFLKVNCAALPTDLLESELFGHRQGAFTGAINHRAGKFEQANGGTLLLDEIGDIGFHMQAKLLHVLQDGQFARLGAQETTKVDVRVLAATNVQMESALSEKKFREDLYYRLSVFTIKVPPLRDRREEIPGLIEEIIRRAPAEMTKGFGSCLPARLMDAALQYEWRGNLRELRNFVTRTIVMRDPEAAARELESRVVATESVSSQEAASEALPCAGIRSVVRDLKDRTEVQMIQSALEACGWNRRRAAQHLNISYRGLLYKIQQHRLRPWAAADPVPARQSAHSVR